MDREAHDLYRAASLLSQVALAGVDRPEHYRERIERAIAGVEEAAAKWRGR